MEEVENVSNEKHSKGKKKTIGIIAGVVAGVVVAGAICGLLLVNGPKDNYVKLKTQEEITRDIATFKTDANYFSQSESGINRFYKEKDETILVVVADDVDQRYYEGYENAITLLNNSFDVINNSYEWEITRASLLNDRKAYIYVQNSELEGTKKMETECEIAPSSNMITGATITIDDANADTLPNDMVGVACLHEILHTLGLQDMTENDYFGRTVEYPYAMYTTQLRLLPYDARNLIAAYADIDTPERLEELKKFTINKSCVANTNKYKDLDMDYGDPVLDW